MNFNKKGYTNTILTRKLITINNPYLMKHAEFSNLHDRFRTALFFMFGLSFDTACLKMIKILVIMIDVT